MSEIKELINGIIQMSMEVNHTYQTLDLDSMKRDLGKLCRADKCPYQTEAKPVVST